MYVLKVTDPLYQAKFRAKRRGEYRLGESFLTVSLAEPYKGHSYKVVAAIIERADVEPSGRLGARTDDPARYVDGRVQYGRIDPAPTAGRRGIPPGTCPPNVVRSRVVADTLMLIRHAEKPKGSSKPYGVTAHGEHSEGSLTVRGWTRAGALVELFAPSHGRVRGGLVRPTAVYAAKPDGDASQRPSETVTPLVARLGAKLNSAYGKGDEKALAHELVGLHGATLVCWQHEEIPAIVAHLGAVHPVPSRQWPDDRFDVVWIFTRTDDGWAYSQVPQLVLDGDRNGVIGH
jgi:hypothetical protein